MTTCVERGKNGKGERDGGGREPNLKNKKKRTKDVISIKKKQ